MLSQRWKCVTGEYTVQQSRRWGRHVGKDETVSRTRKLEHEKKNEEDCALGSHRGDRVGIRESGQVEVVVVLAQALGFLSVVTGEGGDSSLRLSWLLMDCRPFCPSASCSALLECEGHSLSHPQCIMGGCVPSVTAAPCPTLSLLCYEASALGASFRPFFRDGESDVFTVFRGGLTGSLASSCNDGSLYIATV